MKQKIIFKQLHFNASHYLTPEFGKCQYLHGHQWMIRNLVINEEKIIVFDKIKEVVDCYDHCLIIPEKDKHLWIEAGKKLPCELRIKAIPYDLTIVENLKEALASDFMKLDGIISVEFELYETDDTGVFYS